MNKKWLLLGLCLVFTLVLGAAYSRYQPPQWIETVTDETWALRVSEPGVGGRGADSSAGVVFAVLPDGTIAQYDTSGNTTYERKANQVVVIDGRSDLSTFTGGGVAESGQSYYQMQAGHIYEVDLQAIADSDTDTPFTGVTMMLPYVVAANDNMEVGVRLVVTGGTGYATAMAGVTPIYVWPYTNSGVTQSMAYYPNGGVTLPAVYPNAGVGALKTGVSDYNINMLNESITYKLFNNSSVSAQPIARILYWSDTN